MKRDAYRSRQWRCCRGRRCAQRPADRYRLGTRRADPGTARRWSSLQQTDSSQAEAGLASSQNEDFLELIIRVGSSTASEQVMAVHHSHYTGRDGSAGALHMSRYHPCLMASHSDPTLVRARFGMAGPGTSKPGVAGTPPLMAGPRDPPPPMAPPPAGLYSAGVPPVAHAGVPLADGV